MITCRVLGPIEISVDGQPAPGELLWRKNLALLIYLARSPKRTRSRDHLIGLLWPSKPESAARHSLNEAIRVLRKYAGGEEAIRSEGEQIHLTEDALAVDADRLERAVVQASWAEAAVLVAGEFMEGFGVPGCSELEDWLHSERFALSQISVRVLFNRADELLNSGAVAGALAFANRALALDPMSDAAVRVAMRSLAVAGDRAAALRLYETFERRLANDVGIAPAAETRELARRVGGERTWRFQREAAPAGIDGSRRAPLVEREAELEALLVAWSDCRDQRRAAVAMVEGDPGTGKSRLLEELSSRARLDGALVITARAVPADLRDAWSGLLALARGLTRAAGQEERLAAAGEGLIECVERHLDENSIERGSPVRQLVLAMQDTVALHPTLVVLDDAQWVDVQSLGALDSVLRDLEDSPLLVAMAFAGHPRRVELEEIRSRLGRELSGVSLCLRALSVEGIRLLARRVLPAYDEVELDRVARRVSTDSAGLPLLAVEILHAVAGGLDLSIPGGAWPEPLRTLDQTLPGELPEAVVASVRVGFRRLSRDAQTMLAAAAVLDERVDEETLAHATDLAGDRLALALDEAEWLRWLASDPRGYTFIARIVRDVVARDMLTAGQRRRIRDAVHG